MSRLANHRAPVPALILTRDGFFGSSNPFNSKRVELCSVREQSKFEFELEIREQFE